jgi:hypothetical protein
MRIFFWLALCWLATACKQDGDATSFVSDFAYAKKLGRVDPTLEEASGLVASRANPGFLWTHNDSGDEPRIFLINEKGKIVFTCYLQGAANRDWEDIAIGPGLDSTKNYLFVADIGDNVAQYPFKHIYFFEEPVFKSQSVDTLRQFETLTVRLPDGIRDSETLLSDPLTHELILVSKREDSVGVYQIPPPLKSDTVTASYQLTIPYHNINGGDISADGREILLRDYDSIHYWVRSDGTSVAEALRVPGKTLPYKREAQGEAIAFALEGTGYYTLSESPERNWAALLFYRRK